jgi:hypothetical protein
MLITCLLARLVPYGRLVWCLGSGSPAKLGRFLVSFRKADWIGGLADVGIG